MTTSDPIADMLTRIKNGYLSRKVDVMVPFSKFKESLAKTLVNAGYVEAYEVVKEDKFPELKVTLKYADRKPAIEEIKKVSKPGIRIYAGKNNLPKVLSGFGVSIISTSKGLMTDKEARKAGLGGEVICRVW